MNLQPSQLLRLTRKARLPLGMRCRHGLTSTKLLEAVWASDNDAYPGANISLETLQRWSAPFPAGGHVLTEGERIRGVIGLWPVAESSYESLCDGSLGEGEVTIASGTSASQPHAFWYLAGMQVAADLQGTGVFYSFFAAVFKWWVTSGLAVPRPRVAALGYSPSGVRTLLRLGFRQLPVAKSSDFPFEYSFDSPLRTQQFVGRICRNASAS